MKKLTPIKNKAWKAFSAYIRKSHANQDGYVECVTCGSVKKWNEGMQAGHFIDGRNNSILFEEKAVFPQCYACNVCKHGNKVHYYKFMLKKFGQKIIDELIAQASKNKKMYYEDYERIYQIYKMYLKEDQ